MSLIGPIVSAHQVEAQILDVLKKWTHTYLGEAERQDDLQAGRIARPKSYRRTSGETVNCTEHLLPRIVLRSAGYADSERNGDTRTLFLSITVAGFWKGSQTEETLDRIRLIEAAIRTLLDHKAQEAPLVSWITDLEGDYDVVDDERQRTLASFEVNFVARVDEANTIQFGPDDPDPPQHPDPPFEYPDAPLVDEVASTVDPIAEETP